MNDSFYEFEWDEAKAESNRNKYGVTFLDAMSVLLDPLAMTCPDNEPSDEEERWIALGQTSKGQLLVVIHTFHTTAANSALVRLISARLATRHEGKQYEQK